MKRTLLFLICTAILSPLAAYAGVTGILSGKVVDDKGKPLAGASIRINGTNRGGNTKLNGTFLISNINAGSYNVLVKMVNYKDYTTNVKISPDQTTDITVKMVESTLQTKEIVFTDTRIKELVHKDQIGTVRATSGDEMTKVARETVQQTVALKAGVQVDGGGFQVRGSRSSETQIKVDGLDVGDQFTGGFGNGGFNYTPTVSASAVEEVQVMTGAFSAEYGSALGGVVNTVVKTGKTDRYEGFARYRQDAPGLFGTASNGLQLMGKDENSLEFGVGGPLPFLDGSTFYVTGKHAYEKFGSAGIGVIDPWGNNLGQLENTQTWVKNLTGRLKFNFNNINLSVGGQLGLSSRERGSWAWLYANDFGVTNIRTENGRTFGDTNFIRESMAKPAVVNQVVNNLFVLINHTLSDNSFYEFKVSINTNTSDVSKRTNFSDPSLLRGFEVYTPADNYKSEFDPTDPAQIRLASGGDRAIDIFQSITKPVATSDGYATGDILQRNFITGYIEGPSDASPTKNPYGLSGYFNYHGNDRNFDFRRTNILQFDGNFNTVIVAGDLKHNVKAGFEFRTITAKRHYNSLPWDGNAFYDVYTDEFGGNPYADNATAKLITEQPKKPFSGSLYGQDQISYKGIIINPGIRVDFTDPNSTYRLPSPYFTPITSDSGFANTTLKLQVSPRVSIAYPVTDRSVVTIAYGIYFQMPQLNQLFDSYNTDRLRSGSILGNPELPAQRTNQYQIAYNLQLNDDFAFDITAYYKDNYNQVGINRVFTSPDAYDQYSVSEYGNSRGLEFTFKKNPTNNIGFNVNYTIAKTSTTSSSPEDNYSLTTDPYTGLVAFPLSDYPFANDRRHQLNATVDFVWNRDEGPSIGGIKFLENVNLNVTTRYQTGTPYTRLSPKGVVIGDVNGERQPSTWSSDVRFSKQFPLKDWFGEGMGNSSLEFFLDIYNVTNNTFFSAVYPRSGDPDQDNNSYNRQLGDFSGTILYKDATLINANTFRSDQYDKFGDRLYAEQIDFNKDGQVTQAEKYQSYQNFVKDAQARLPNYLAPRRVFFGFKLNF